MDPNSLFSGFGAIGGYGPKTEKKNESGPLSLLESAVKTHRRSVPSSSRKPAVLYGGFALVYYHKPNLFVPRVNG